MRDIDPSARKKVQKVYRGYHKRADYSYVPHPIIRLSGFYLSDFDFEIGDKIAVEIENGKIMITKLNAIART